MSSSKKNFSATECFAWRDCPAAAYAAYVQGIRPPNSARMRPGVLAHAACAAHLRRYAKSRGVYASGTDSPEEAVKEALRREEWETYEDTPSEEEHCELALEIAGRAISGLDLGSHRFEMIEHDGEAIIERRFYADLPPETKPFYTGRFKAIVDWAAKDHEYGGRLALVDFKFTGSVSAPDELPLDVQLGCYQHVMGLHGLWPDLAWQYRILAKASQMPELLSRPTKGRRLSVRMDSTVTEDSFLRACEVYGEDPNNPAYAAFREALSMRRMWSCSVSGMSREQAAAVFREAINTAVMAARYAEGPADLAVRNARSFAGAPCMRCPFRRPCFRSSGTASMLRLIDEDQNPQPLPELDLGDFE